MVCLDWPAGACRTTATNENAMLYNTDAQTIAAGGTLSPPANSINSTGSITASGTTGVTLAAGAVPRDLRVRHKRRRCGDAWRVTGAWRRGTAVRGHSRDAGRGGCRPHNADGDSHAHNGAAADRDKQQRLLEHLHEQHAHHSETCVTLKHTLLQRKAPLYRGAFVISYRLFVTRSCGLHSRGSRSSRWSSR